MVLVLFYQFTVQSEHHRSIHPVMIYLLFWCLCLMNESDVSGLQLTVAIDLVR